MTEWPINWRDVVDEAIRRRKADGLTQRSLAALAGVSLPTVNAFEQGEINLRFERVIAILETLGLFDPPGRGNSFEAFLHGARRRWGELVAPLPGDHPARQPHGHSEQAYAILGLSEVPPLGQLRERLNKIPPSSGWSPFWIPTRPALRPTIEDGVIECWLGRPEAHRVFTDPAHSDFWHVSRDPFAYLQRGYQEDGPDNLEPGTIFDLTLPIWRTGEFMLHAVRLARLLGGGDDTEIRFAGRYTGLEGRVLLSWAKPLEHALLGERHRARSHKVELAAAAPLAAVEQTLETVIGDFVSPLYERFDGFQPSRELIAQKVAELRRFPTLRVVQR